jgi:hypothetical protein
MKVSKVPKGRDKQFASGGRTKMFGAGDRTKSRFPAVKQVPGQTSQHAPGKPIPKARSAANPGGDMGGTAGSSQPRRPAA